jgi:hypothetical protein
MWKNRPTYCGVLLIVACAGCARSFRLGPEQPFVHSPAELAQRMVQRVSGVQTFVDVRASARAGLIPAPTEIYISNELGFRLQVKNPITPEPLASLIINNEEGEFVAIDYRKNKAVRGETEQVQATYLPKLGLAANELAPMKLFFPTFEIGSELKSAMITEGHSYVAELWNAETGPRMQIYVDAWTLVPTALRLYHEGDVLVEFTWSDLAWRPEESLVIAKTVHVRLPQRGKAITLATRDPKINKEISPKAFRLRIPPGIDVEEVGAQSGQD